MKVLISFDKKEIHFEDDVSLDEMAFYMNNYFPTDTWGDFKFMIDAGTYENTDNGGEFSLPF